MKYLLTFIFVQSIIVFAQSYTEPLFVNNDVNYSSDKNYEQFLIDPGQLNQISLDHAKGLIVFRIDSLLYFYQLDWNTVPNHQVIISRLYQDIRNADYVLIGNLPHESQDRFRIVTDLIIYNGDKEDIKKRFSPNFRFK